MSGMRSWPLGGLVVVASMLFAIAGCSRGDNSSGASAGGQLGSLGGRAAGGQDPCTLVSATEAEPYVGAITIAPYRATDGDSRPDIHGTACIYRGTSGRVLAIKPDWSGGRTMGRMLQLPNALGKALAKGAPGMDSLANRIAQHDATGPWDQATWMPTGVLFVSKGPALVIVDVSGATGRKPDAMAIASIAVGRIGRPLAYDGAKAVASVPKPTAHPSNACDLVPRAEVEAAIGPLSAAPEPDSTGTGCTYQVSTPQGTRSYPVSYAWEDGGHVYNMQKHQMAMMGGMLGMPAGSPLDTLKPTGNMGAMMGALMKMAGGASHPAASAPSPLDTMKPTAANLQKAMRMAATPTTASGAVTSVGFTTDTTLQGPWDDASLLHGTLLIGVRDDVFVGMSLESADYAKAKALLAAICTHL